MKYLSIVVFLLLSCSFDRGEDGILIVLPQPSALEKEVWGDFHWELETLSCDGFINHGRIDGDSYCLQVERGAFLALWVYPVALFAKGPQALSLPAGGLYPSDLRRGRLELDWEGGLLAHFFLELVRREGPGGRRAACFNWRRLRLLFEEDRIEKEAGREGLLPRDPWSIDWALAAQKTLDSGFDRRRLALPKKGRAIVFPAVGGPFLADSPWLRSQGTLQESSFILYGEGIRFHISSSHVWKSGPFGSLLIPRTKDAPDP